MSKLMDELMAEITRVNNLETEVERTIAQQGREIGLARQEKLNDIFEFMLPLGKLLVDAKAIHDHYDRGIFYVEIPYNNYKVGFYDGGKDFLIYTPTYGMRHIYDEMCMNERYPSVLELIDLWCESIEDVIVEGVMRKVKDTLAKRVEKSTANLKLSNNKHAEYYGMEE